MVGRVEREENNTQTAVLKSLLEQIDGHCSQKSEPIYNKSHICCIRIYIFLMKTAAIMDTMNE